MISLVEDLL